MTDPETDQAERTRTSAGVRPDADRSAETHTTGAAQARTREPIFELKDVSVRYGGNLAVDDVIARLLPATRSRP